jgi:hypothetical protein
MRLYLCSILDTTVRLRRRGKNTNIRTPKKFNDETLHQPIGLNFNEPYLWDTTCVDYVNNRISLDRDLASRGIIRQLDDWPIGRLYNVGLLVK